MNTPADELIASISPNGPFTSTRLPLRIDVANLRNGLAPKKVRAQPNWRRILALESQVSALRLNMRDVQDRAWKWNLTVFGFGLLLGAVVDTAVRAL